MTVIELSDADAAALKAKAAAQGLTLQDWIHSLAQGDVAAEEPVKPLKSGYGMLSKYGTAPSAEELAANRREMFQGFAKDVG